MKFLSIELGTFNNLVIFVKLFLIELILLLIFISRPYAKLLILINNSDLTGTTFSAAAVGVEALKSDT